MPLELTTLEIQILLRCSSGLVSKTDITQLFRSHPLKEKIQAIDHLIDQRFIYPQEMPKPNSKKIPVFYEITENGKKWVKNYLSHYPK